MGEIRKCKGCGVEFVPQRFHPYQIYHSRQCKGRDWIERNREKAKAQAAAWKKRNREKVNKASREWAKKNPEKHRKSCAAWDKKNLEKVRKRCATWKRNNPEKRKKGDAESNAKRRAYSLILDVLKIQTTIQEKRNEQPGTDAPADNH